MAVERTSPKSVLAARGPQRFAEWLFVAFLLLVFVGFDSFRQRDFATLANVASGEGDIVRQAAYLAVFAVLAALFVGIRRVRSVEILPLSMTLVLLWCFLSTIWSLAPDITLRRTGLTALIIVSVFMVTDILGAERSLRAVRNIFAGILVVNLVAIFLVPQAIHQYNGFDASELAGSWRGMYYHKNVAGPVTALSALLFLHVAIDQKRRIDWLLFMAAVVFLVGTRSKAAIALFVVAMLAGLLYRAATRTRSGQRLFVGFCVALLVVSVGTSIVLRDTLIEILEDPGVFTGRGAIWQVVFTYVQSHLLLGSGFGAFWQIGPNSPVLALTDARWLLFTAQTHNGYLEMLVSTGVVGLGFATVATVLAPLGALLSFRCANGGLLLSWILFGILLNLTETSFFERDSEEWVFYVIALSLLRLSTKHLKARSDN